MAAKGYTTQADVENYILNDIDNSFVTQLAAWIEAVEQYIDKYTGRNFVADSEASARLFGGSGGQDLLIDECIAITKVEVGADVYGSSFTEISAGGADGYFMYPENYSSKNLPIYKVRLAARIWPEGYQNNRITAKWGFSATVPEDISFVATVLVAGILNQHKGGGDKVTQERIGNYTVSYDTNDSDALADFKRAMQILDSNKRILL